MPGHWITFAPMKKWLLFLLLIITAAGSFIPCQDNDCCAESLITSSTDHNHKEGTCSPFFSCATCPGVVELPKLFQLVLPFVGRLQHHEAMATFDLSAYPASFWQPPRIAC